MDHRHENEFKLLTITKLKSLNLVLKKLATAMKNISALLQKEWVFCVMKLKLTHVRVKHRVHSYSVMITMGDDDVKGYEDR